MTIVHLVARYRAHSARWFRPASAPLLGEKCLNTSAASSSPRDISMMAASLRALLIHRKVVRSGPGSDGFAVHHWPFSEYWPRAMGFSSLASMRASSRRSCSGRHRQQLVLLGRRRQGGTLGQLGFHPRRRRATCCHRGWRAGPCGALEEPGEQGPSSTSAANSTATHGPGKALRPTPAFRAASTAALSLAGVASTWNGVFIRLTESPRSLLKPMVSRTRAVICSSCLGPSAPSPRSCPCLRFDW